MPLDDAQREKFLTRYEMSRATGKVDDLEPFVSEEVVLEDPQLPRGMGGRALFFNLTRELAGKTRGLRLERYGPTCVSTDGSWFTQRWFADGELNQDPAARVSFETVEMYHAPESQVTRIAIFVRDLTRVKPGASPISESGS